MKILLPLFLIFTINVLNAQNITSFMVRDNIEERLIHNSIYSLEQGINSKNSLFLSTIVSDSIKSNKKLNIKSLANSDKVKINVSNVKISGNSALIQCTYQVYNADSLSKVNVNFLHMKKDKEWKFVNLEKMNDIVSNALNISSQQVNSLDANTTSSSPFATVNFKYSENTYIPCPFLEPGIYELNSTLTQDNLQVQLYDKSSAIDFAVFTNAVYDDGHGDYAVLTLDSRWERIVFSNNSSKEIKSYGDHPGDVQFFVPTAIDVNEFGEVYVVDNEAKKIFKLFYSYGTNSITALTNINIGAGILQDPVDIDYCSYSTSFNRSDDFILVTDKGRKSILKFDVNGNLITEYKKFILGNIDYDIHYPSRIVTDGDFVQFIDTYQNILVSGLMSEGGNTIFCPPFGNIYRFPGYSKPSDVGIDASYNVVVPDYNINVLHKFDRYGNYLCSYKSPNNLISPVNVSNSTFSYPDNPLLDFTVTESWSPTKGAEKFLPGADVIDMKNIDHTTYWEFECVFTDRSYYKFEIIKCSDNSIAYTETGSTWGGGEKKSLLINRNQLTVANYKWRVSFLPRSNSSYGNYSIAWKNKEITFDNTIYNNITLNSIQYLEQTSLNEGCYKINDEVKNTIVVPQGQTVKIEAFPVSPNWIFNKWSDNNLSNPRYVQLNNNMAINAVYKGHLLSDNSNATAGSNGRKLAYHRGVTYAVYSSMGSIWFTKKNTGSEWIQEINIGEGENPSIVVISGVVHVVWQRRDLVYGKREVFYTSSSDGGNMWPDVFCIYYGSQNYDTTPIIIGWNTPVIVWRGADGLYALVNPALNNISQKITGTNSNSQAPSGAAMYNSSGTDQDFLVYSDGDYIWYKEFATIYTSIFGETDPYLVSGGSSSVSNRGNPTITVDNIGSNCWVKCVAWDGIMNGNLHYAFYREQRNYDLWQDVCTVNQWPYQLTNPSLCIDPVSKKVTMICQYDGHLLESDKDVSQAYIYNWSQVADLGSGTGPNLLPNLTTGVPLTAMCIAGSAAPYNIKFIEFRMIPSGTILQDANTTWDGVYSVLGNVTVPAGKTLTIRAGSVINIMNRAQLIVNGTLNIQGTGADSVIVDFITPATSYPANCIMANSGSHININYANVKNAGIGLYAIDAEVHIDNSNFHNMVRTVYFYNQVKNTYGSTIKNSSFSTTTAEGIWFRNSSDSLSNNKITNTVEGLRLSDNSSPAIHRNTLKDNYAAITARAACIPKLMYNNLIKNSSVFGIYAWGYSVIYGYYGNNTFQTTTGYHIYLEYSCLAYVDHTYWGEYPPDYNKFFSDASSSIFYYDYLQSDPGTGSNLLKTTQPTDDLELAYSEMTQDNYDNAEKLFKKVIADKFDEKESRFALSGLASCYLKNNKSGFKKFLVNSIKNRIKDTKNDLYRLFLELNSYFSVQEGNYDEALANIKSLRNNFTLDAESKKDLDFREGMINLVFKGNVDMAKSIFEKIKSEHPDTMTRFDVDIALQAYENGAFANIKNIQYKLNQEQKVGKAEDELPVNFGLDQNYPNPFNPMTSIKYALPQNSRVTLEVYSILGEKVASLVDEVKSAGYHEAVFNGSNLSSGIYIYRLTANSLETGERFVKSAKMLLMK